MGGHYLFVPVGSHPEQAFRFRRVPATDEACDMIYEGNGWLPARKSYRHGRYLTVPRPDGSSPAIEADELTR